MPRARQVLEVRCAHVIHVLGVEGSQFICGIEGQAAGIVGALEMFLGGIERHGFVEIEIAYVIDRQLGVEAEAVGEVEFHAGLGFFERGWRINSGSRVLAHLLIRACRINCAQYLPIESFGLQLAWPAL
jgi:hypothetical protein